MLIQPVAARTPEQVEWPTVALIVTWATLLVIVVAGHASIPWFVSVPLLALLGGLQFSLQHEAIHGHPTPSAALNAILVGAPLSVWCTYHDYRRIHLLHHASELTVPGRDPESFYISAATWDDAGPVWRALMTANRTLLGRLALGPWIAISGTLRSLPATVRTDAAARRAWAVHLPLAAVTLWACFGLAGVPVWEYVVGLVWGGLALTNLRSFVEHRDIAGVGTPSAVVRSNPFFSLLFLNNNLHHTHHALPGVAWYRLPGLHRDLGSDDIARDGAGWYPGYIAVASRYLLRPFDHPVHSRDSREPAV